MKKTKRKASRRHKAKPNVGAAIVKVEPPASLAPPPRQGFSIAPKVKQTVQDTEQIRRFISTCLNVDYRRKAPKIKQAIQDIYAAGGGHGDLSKEQERKIYKLENDLEALEIDWGTIPGSKPFLKQPGAEKFMLWLNVRPIYHKQVTEIGDGHLEMVCYVTYKVKGGEEEVFEGPEASCTTMETNFRYIWAESQHTPTQDEVDRGYQTKMGKWMWIKKWKSGKSLGTVKTWFIKIDNPNIWNERNKVRQQGQKRAVVKGVRNMGAISEIFQAGPDEWDIPPEDDEPQEDSRDVDMDYTEGGRQVFVNGKSPSGRVKSAELQREEDLTSKHEIAVSKTRGTWCERHKGDYSKCPADEHSDAENEAMWVAEQDARSAAKKGAAPAQTKTEQPKYKGGVFELDWTEDENNPILRALGFGVADLALVIEEIQRKCFIEWGRDDWWHIDPYYVASLRELLVRFGLRLDEIKPAKPAPPKPAPPAPAKAAAPQTKQEKPKIPEPVLECGIIDRVNYQTVNKRLMAYITIAMSGKRKATYSSWDKDINDEINKGQTREIEFYSVQKGQYLNLVGLKRIGKQEYHDGKIPVVQQKDRQPGGKTLWG
jgi:hypothetical protein